MNRFQINTGSYTAETIQQDGKTFLKVPVVMIREGVHAGSHGPLLHKKEIIAAYASQWEGTPVTIAHPVNASGQFISANTQGVVHVGRITGPVMDGDKLKAYAVLDVEVLQAVSPQTLALIQASAPMNVSTGAFSDEQPERGTWNSESYQAVTTSYQPDHLALLPNERGACSLQDGCGIRNNVNMGGNMNEEQVRELKEGAIRLLQVNVSLQEKLRAVSGLVDALDVRDANGNWSVMHSVEDVFEDAVIYRKRDQSAKVTFWRQPYITNAEDQIEFAGEPIQVKRVVQYPPLQANVEEEKPKRTIFHTNTNTMTVETKVNELITNNQFTECDRQWLLTQSLEVLNSLGTRTPQTNKQVTPPAPGSLTLADALAMMKEEDKIAVNTAIETQNQIRTSLIEKITANTASGWTKEELQPMSIPVLTKIANNMAAPAAGQNTQAFYGVQGAAPVQANTADEEPLYQPS